MKLLVLGDSHIKPFSKKDNPGNKYTLNYNVEYVGGASAQGAVNPKSKTNALKIFTETLEKEKLHDFICLQLGEVDCGFVIWYRAHKHNISVNDQFNISLDNYTKFIKKTVEKYYSPEKIIVLSTPLPTIKDNTNPSILSGGRREVKASLKSRTDLTIKYNKHLEAICRENSYKWVSVLDETLNKETGLVDDKWINRDPKDHHLNPKVCILYEKKILKEINYED